ASRPLRRSWSARTPDPLGRAQPDNGARWNRCGRWRDSGVVLASDSEVAKMTSNKKNLASSWPPLWLLFFLSLMIGGAIFWETFDIGLMGVEIQYQILAIVASICWIFIIATAFIKYKKRAIVCILSAPLIVSYPISQINSLAGQSM